IALCDGLRAAMAKNQVLVISRFPCPSQFAPIQRFQNRQQTLKANIWVLSEIQIPILINELEKYINILFILGVWRCLKFTASGLGGVSRK
ncbi:MAG: hypothetical protein SV583_01795, partial [Pseudomonadota bacterium]|nr:hypothetical protein [Pseudomonadota bacterium]